MNKTTIKKLLSCILCAALAWTVAFGIIGCSDNKPAETPEGGAPATVTDVGDAPAEAPEDGILTAVTDIGEGERFFAFTVTDKSGAVSRFNVKTDKTTVGEALIELGLIEGDMGDFGLYVKKVNGIVADYDVDGTYWAFYENGSYAMAGVDLTEIEDGTEYGFKVE